MEVVRQYPTMLHKCTELLEQLGDQLGGGRQDLQQVLSILELEMTREQRWMEHDRAKQRTSHRANMFGKSIDIAGPDLMALLRKVFEMATEAAHGGTKPPAPRRRGLDYQALRPPTHPAHLDPVAGSALTSYDPPS